MIDQNLLSNRDTENDLKKQKASPIREVTSELRLIEGNLLHAHCPLARFILNYFVYERKRVPMGKDFVDVFEREVRFDILGELRHCLGTDKG